MGNLSQKIRRRKGKWLQKPTDICKCALTEERGLEEGEEREKEREREERGRGKEEGERGRGGEGRKREGKGEGVFRYIKPFPRQHTVFQSEYIFLNSESFKAKFELQNYIGVERSCFTQLGNLYFSMLGCAHFSPQSLHIFQF